MTQPLGATDVAHGSFVYSCWHDHGGADFGPGYDFAAGVPVIAGTDSAGGLYAYGRECMQEIVGYDRSVMLHGTHTLTDDQLAELGVVRGPESLPYRTLHLNQHDLMRLDAGRADDSDYVCVAITAHGVVHLVTLERFEQLAHDPTELDERRLMLYGTHVLPDDILASPHFDRPELPL